MSSREGFVEESVVAVSEDTRALVADDPFVGAELRERLEIAGMSNAPPPGIIVEAASYKIGSNSLLNSAAVPPPVSVLIVGVLSSTELRLSAIVMGRWSVDDIVATPEELASLVWSNESPAVPKLLPVRLEEPVENVVLLDP